MAQIDDRALLPTERPSTSVPDAGIHLNVRASQFGGQTAEALQQFGSTALTAGQHWGQIAADDVSTQWETATRKLLYGDPTKTVTKADGTTGQDTGYFGLQGDLALKARPAIEQQMDQLTKDARGKLVSFDQQKAFDGVTRRYRNIQSTKIGEYADRQGKVYASGVNTATIKEQVESIAVNPNDDDMFLHHTANMVDAATKNAQLQGAVPGDAMWNSAQNAAKAAAAETRIRAIGANDPVRAIRMADQYKTALGSHYDNVVDHLRARADQQEGRQVADGILSGAAPPAGDDTKAVIRHFEDHRTQAYQDNGGAFRVGYGSDTVTRPDGTVVPVTPQTVVTREDSERDLERRAALSQKAVRDKVGGEAFDALSPQAKASLTSIAYNYGSGNIPQTVVDAAKTGDPAKIATAIRGLSGHNNGINRGRRASEANNVSPGGGAEPSSQAEQIAEVQAKNLPPAAEAAAVARINKSHALQNAVETKRKAEFKQRTDDGLAEALTTGQAPSNPMTEGDFIKHFGPEDGAAKYADYNSNIQYGIDRHSLETMPDAEMQTFVSRQPQPGKPGYAHAVNRQVQLQKDAATLQKGRREDPAGAVAQNGAVQGAQARYDEKDPASFKALADARMQAQEDLGIEPEYRTPITKAEALKYGQPLALALPGQKGAELEKLGDQYRKRFGENAPKAFLYTLKALHVQGTDLANAEGVFESLTKGTPITEAERRDQRDKEQAAQIESALQAKAPPTSAPTWMENPGGFDMMPSIVPDWKKSEAPKATPNGQAIRDLRNGKLVPTEYDKLFGAGAAKKLIETYPSYFGQQK